MKVATKMNRVYSEQAVNELLGILASVIYQGSILNWHSYFLAHRPIEEKVYQLSITIKKNQ